MNVIEPLVNFYKDWNYVQYVLNTDFEIAYKLFLKMRSREIEILEVKNENRAFQMFLKSNIPGIKFSEYYDNMKKQNENESMTDLDKEKEEKRIYEKYSKLNINDFRKQVNHD